MSEPKRPNSRGKWLALGLLIIGVISALAEWKFRPDPNPRWRVNPATAPASRAS